MTTVTSVDKVGFADQLMGTIVSEGELWNRVNSLVFTASFPMSIP
jgi:hypothetical protein